MENEHKLCCNCVNWIEDENGKTSCDLSFFSNCDIYKALLFIPELFDCFEYEDIREV